MGDGVIRQFVLAVNGDDEERHLANIERHLGVMEGPAVDFETFVISPEEPEALHDHYATPTLENVNRFVQEISNRIDDDDELVIYTTGHGDRRDNRGSICLGDDCYTTEIEDLLQSITYGNRVVVMDQCLSGDWGHRFAAPGLRTRFYSSGSEDEMVCCAEWAPRFWSSAIEGLNWDARYAFALENTISSNPLSLQSADFVEGAAQQFSTQVQSAASKDELTALLGALGHEQYAVVFFSLEGCPGCRAYNERFDELAREGEGRYLFIKAEGEWTVDELEVLSYPSVYIFDRQMRMHQVGDIDDVLGEMGQFSMSLTDRLAIFRARLDDMDVQSRRSALTAYAGLAEDGDAHVMLEALGVLEEMIDDQSSLVYIPAGQLYISMLAAISFRFMEAHVTRALGTNPDGSPVGETIEPEVVTLGLLENLDHQERKEIEGLIDYIVGRLTFAIRPEIDGSEIPPPDQLQRYLFHPNPEVRRTITAMYTLYCTTSLGEPEAALEIRKVRELMQMTDVEILSESARQFGTQAELLDIRRRSDAEQAFLNEVTPQAIRYQLAAAYVSLFYQLSVSEQLKETQEIIEMSYADSDNVAHAVTVIIAALGLSEALLRR